MTNEDDLLISRKCGVLVATGYLSKNLLFWKDFQVLIVKFIFLGRFFNFYGLKLLQSIGYKYKYWMTYGYYSHHQRKFFSPVNMNSVTPKFFAALPKYVHSTVELRFWGINIFRECCSGSLNYFRQTARKYGKYAANIFIFIARAF